MLDFLRKLKDNFYSFCNAQDLYNKKEYKSCVERWATDYGKFLERNGNSYTLKCYKEFFKNVTTNQLVTDNEVFVLFRYTDGCDFDFSPLIRQCRSVVIDVKNMEIAILPFDKFFNINEREETKLERVEELLNRAHYITFTDKLDGSMQCARFYNGRILLTGSMGLDRYNPDSWRVDSGYRFIESDKNLQKLIESFPNTTFIFEHISKEDEHVVKYSEDRYGLHLIGARDVDSGRHWTYDELEHYAKLFNLKNITTREQVDLLDVMFEKLKYSAAEKEGWVMHAKIGEEDFFVKIKCDDYLGVHRILNSIRSDKAIIKAIAENKLDDFMSVVPDEYKSELNTKIQAIFLYISNVKALTCEAVKRCKGYSDDEKERQIWITDNIASPYANNVRRTLRELDCKFLKENDKMEDIINFNFEKFYKIKRS